MESKLERKIRETIRALTIELESGTLTQFGCVVVTAHGDIPHCLRAIVTTDWPHMAGLLHETIDGHSPENIEKDLSSLVIEQ